MALDLLMLSILLALAAASYAYVHGLDKLR